MELHQTKRNTERGGNQNADEDGAAHVARGESGDDQETETRQQRWHLGEVPERDKRRRVAGDDAHLVQADKAEKQADAGADTELQRH